MKVTFLGTGTSQGVPVIGCNCEVCQSIDFRDKRLRSSILIEKDGTNIVVDTGPDFRQQMLSNNVQHLDAVLYTHEHKDHVAGMDDIRSFNFKQKKDMPIYAQSRVIDRLKKEFSYVFAENKYPGVPAVEVHEIDTDTFTANGVEISPIQVWHYKLPILGYKIDNFAYLTDVKTIDDSEKEKLQNLDILVLNALQHKEHISHLTLQEAIDLVGELQPKKALFTHISHKLGLHREVQKILPDHIDLSYDGMIVHC
ncbi:MBL fold metallo-hydrolase [Reichenbachiella versicolor]|uniref:MBL fold metallo-hydrolase n=1 Tax=Reichenbachiella versicolor TaxID=1821036 RepID=UPI000D6DCD8C|nr:MBL fold metallo-hydrolase [Reichenbachiella versicolor]